MTIEEKKPTETLRYWTDQREEIHRWFQDHAPPFAHGYKAAVELLYSHSFPARVNLICHLVRDIYRLLPAELGSASSQRLSDIITPMARKLTTLWEKFPPIEIEKPTEIGWKIIISDQVHNEAENLVNKCKDNNAQPSIGKYLAIALYQTSSKKSGDFIAPWVFTVFDKQYNYFVKKAHINTSHPDDGLEEHFEEFENAFHSFVGKYFSGKKELDDILQDTN